MLKKLFLVSFLVFTLAGVTVAQAQDGSTIDPGNSATCVVNGVEVPCDQAFGDLAEKAGAGLGLGLGIIFLFFAVGLAAFVFWIMMLVHAIKYPIENKVLWLLLILLTGIIGSIVYYFAVKKNYGKTVMSVGGNMPPSNMPPSNPSGMPPSGMGQ